MKSGFKNSPARTIVLQIVVLLVGLMGASDAHAYVDPGTASMAVQALLAALAAGAATAAVFWRQVKAMIARIFGGKEDGKKDGQAE